MDANDADSSADQKQSDAGSNDKVTTNGTERDVEKPRH